MIGLIAKKISRILKKESGEIYFVCGSDSYFSDDIQTKCDVCEVEVVARPHTFALREHKGGILICTECALKKMKAEADEK